MEIIKKETIKFSKEEKDGLEMVSRICTGIMAEANDPYLRKLAKETFENIYKFLECEENEM